MVAERSNPFFPFFLSPAPPTFPRSLRALFRFPLCSQSPRHSPGEGSGLVRLRQPMVCWELKFRRRMKSPFRLPQTDHNPLDALRVGAREGRREGGGGRRGGGGGGGGGSRRPAARGEGARSGSAGGSGKGRWRQRLADSSHNQAEADTSVKRGSRSTEHRRRHRDPRLGGGGRRTGRRGGGDAGSHGGAQSRR